jgi:hypothetical protein
MTMDRRTFLKTAAAAAPCIFGLRELFAQEGTPASTAPAWFKEALARMKERKLHGVVLIAPATAAEEKALGMALWDLLDGDHAAAHELFTGGVFIGMSPAIAVACGLRKEGEKENRILLDPEGMRVVAESFASEALKTGDAFAGSFEPFLFGKEAERLKARAEELLKTSPDELRSGLRELGGEDIEVRERAAATVQGHAADYHPLYSWLRRSAPDAEVRSALRSILERLYQSAKKDAFGPRLPFGTRVPKFVEGGCGGWREAPMDEKDDKGSMVACGMARIEEPKVRLFLRFLTK